MQYWRFAKSLDVLDAAVRPDFQAFFNEVKALNLGTIRITSARRSVKHQWLLYTKKMGSGYKTARPCRSDHQYGFAVDINVDRADLGKPRIRKASADSEWREIAAVAARHNIRWYGPGDEVHFYHAMASSVLGKLKQKCTDYYWTTYTQNFWSWPNNFPDDLTYIDPPVEGVPMAADPPAAIAAGDGASTGENSPPESDEQPQDQDPK
jgi:hypothetical protein